MPTPDVPASDLGTLISGLATGGMPPTGPATTDATAPSYDPSLYESGGVYGPTGGLSTIAASAPQIASAVQDPSAQIPDTERQVDRTTKGDRATTQTGDQVDRTGKTNLASALGLPTPGPTGFTPTPADAAAAGQPTRAGAAAATPQGAGLPPEDLRQRGLQALRQQAQQTAPVAPGDQPVAPQAPAAVPQPAGGQQQQAPTPQAPPAQRPPAAAAPTNPLQAMNAFGGGLLGGLDNFVANLLRQLFGGGIPGMPGAPVVAPRSQWARGQAPAWKQPPSGGPNTAAQATGTEQPEAHVPTPGSNANVAPPTQAQVRQSVLAGTDTPPTAGFSSYLAQQRSKYREELKDPRVRAEVAAIAYGENAGDPAAVVERLMNGSDYAKMSLRDMIHSGFYGPVNRGHLPSMVMHMNRNPTEFAKMNAGIETALRGSNLIGGATDQGSGRDPNVGWSGGRVRRFGEVYNDWGGGPGGHAGAARWRRQQQEQIRLENESPQYQASHAFGTALTMDLSGRTPLGQSGRGPELEGGSMAPSGAGAIRSSITPDPGQLGRIEDERRRRQQRQEAAVL
ncbi:MAG: hypothetical protein C5B60_04495 [Chloroflexi bacterium]|nr:MAG: hypothetical protein C5B60_04495 [Chloroflexota bacterium]